ncbi:dTMP kinase [Candidatus Dependentiae bacterium]|nr:dTMP kinase [Candidatus Dependentiae bacterium]
MCSRIKRGIFLTLEGIDGSGKSSALKALYTELSLQYNVIATREPGATPIGKHIRDVVQSSSEPLCPRAEFLLFAADRAQHFHEIVLPYLADSYIVISDRMADSSLAYQGYGRGLDKEFIKTVNEWVTRGVKPDCTFYLRTDQTVARERVNRRLEIKTTIEKEHNDFFQRVTDGFEAIFNGRSDVIVIDASQNQKKVHEDIIQAVYTFLSFTKDAV